MVQSYRNYSRILKQYCYGDSRFEQLIILELRNIFRVPFECETPVELIKHGGVFYFIYYNSKEEWLINLIEIMNFLHIIHIQCNCFSMN